MIPIAASATACNTPLVQQLPKGWSRKNSAKIVLNGWLNGCLDPSGLSIKSLPSALKQGDETTSDLKAELYRQPTLFTGRVVGRLTNRPLDHILRARARINATDDKFQL